MCAVKYSAMAIHLVEKMNQIDFETLGISNYNKEYIAKMKPMFSYFFNINAACLKQGIEALKLSPDEISMIDYGGGSGFLSMLAKEIGIKQVIYIDINPDSVQTIGVLKQKTGIGPDVILHGDSDFLMEWCNRNAVLPQLLVATDLIEHVYDLNLFFDNLMRINNQMQMVFSTASNPCNPFTRRKLHKMMLNCEQAKDRINFVTLRQQYILKEFPEMGEQKALEWSKKTRGLKYEDIKKAVEHNTAPVLTDKYNTCNPLDGSWAERILPIKTYRNLLKNRGYILEVTNLCYYRNNKNIFIHFLLGLVNLFISISGRLGIIFAPVIILSFKKKN